MSYALVINGQIEREGLAESARRLDTSEWVLGLATAPDELKAACGYLPVVPTPQPDHTPTETFDRTLQMIGQSPTVVWVVRPKTDQELNPPITAEVKLVIVKEKLAELAALPAPLLVADVAEKLIEIQEAI